MTKIILSNQVICLRCKDTPYSSHVHDFKYCSCGAIAVDGGQEYLRRVFNSREDWEDISIEMEKDKVDFLKDEIQIAINRGCNSFGILCATIRALRDWDIKLSDNK